MNRKYTLKSCPVCKSKSILLVQYAHPDPSLWTTDFANRYIPKVPVYRFECIKCGATPPELHSSLRAAIEDWNFVRGSGYRSALAKYKTLKVEPHLIREEEPD